MITYIKILIFFILIGEGILYSQETKSIPKGIEIEVDGVIIAGEWDDANKVQIMSAGNKIVKVYFKHDSSNLLFAYCGNLDLGSYNFRFPEIYLEINNDKSRNWKEDDWWFHVSATNCFHRGAPNIYDNCRDEQPDWEANNFSFLTPDTVEIKIPFNLVGIDSNTDAIGISFDVTNTYSIWEYYPSTSDSLDPSTWATGIIEKETSAEDNDTGTETIMNYPSPFSGITNFNYKLKEWTNVNLTIYNLLGDKIITLVNESQGRGEYYYQFNPENLAKGIYVYRFNVGNKTETGKIVYESR